MKSFFIDTNYFLRFLIRENEEQFIEANKIFESGADGKITLITSTIVFFEIYWVLSSFYSQDKTKHIPVLLKILGMDFVLFDEREILQKSLDVYKKNSVELEDCYNLVYAKMKNCKSLASFDKKLQKLFF